MTKAILFTCLTIMLLVVCPLDLRASICQDKTAIVYTNGMFNTKDDAKKASIELRKKLRNYPQAADIKSEFEHYLAYASDNGATGLSLTSLEQIYEVYIQKRASDSSGFWRALGGLDILPDWLSAKMNDLATSTIGLRI